MEITKEQKEAIEFIKDLIAWDVRQDLCPNKEECENLETILNLIEKLQKENEELKEENEYNKLLLELNNNFTIDKKTGNYKWNVIEIQKVKDKIRHYQELQDNYIKKYDEINESLQAMINVLQELIEESEK